MILFLVISGLSVIIAGCASKKEEGSESRSAPAKSIVALDGSIHLTAEQVQANRIQTTAVIEQELAPTISTAGRVAPRSGGEAEVFSPFPGRIVGDPVKLPHVGSVVRRGQVIAQVEQLFNASEKLQFRATIAQLQSTLDQTKQEVSLRQIELNRARRLYEGGAVPLKQVQTAEFNLKQAQERLDGSNRQKAQYEAALAQQDGPRRAPIIAPITGVVTVAELVAGQLTDPSKSLLTVVDLTSVWVEVPIHESDLAAVREARRAEITTPATPGRNYHGKLILVGNVVDPQNRTVPVTFAVENLDGSLKIGMTAEARVPTGSSSKVLLIPFSAVLFEESQSIVYIETEPNVFRRQVIVTGERNGDLIVVTSGLKAGDKVVSVGAASLRSESLKGQIPTEEG